MKHLLKKLEGMLAEKFEQYSFKLGILPGMDPLDPYRLQCDYEEIDIDRAQRKIIAIPLHKEVLDPMFAEEELYQILVEQLSRLIEEGPKPVAKVKPTEVSPIKKTFAGYQCPNCGAMLTVDKHYEMHCAHCGQTFYSE